MVISQPAPTSCIQVPMLEAMVAIHSMRKVVLRNGLQAPEGEVLMSEAAFEWVFDDQVDAIDVIAGLSLVGAVADMGERQAQVFGRT